VSTASGIEWARTSARVGVGACSALVALALLMTLSAAHAEHEAHSGHQHHVLPSTTRSLLSVQLPDVKLVRDDGKAVRLREELADGRPVVLSFIYTTCTSICPLTSQVLSELQGKLGPARDKVHLISISIDPEQDTPARLREYALKFGAGPQWQHYTGTLADSVASQRAFHVYRVDKMSHAPVTFLRTSQDVPWVRIDGFATSDQLLAELRPLIAAR
jgi:protein SCO1/2